MLKLVYKYFGQKIYLLTYLLTNPALREVAATSRKDKIISESKQYIDKSYRTSLVTSTTQSLER